MQVVRDFMSRNVATVETRASVRQAAQLMAEHDVGFLPVLHESVTAGVVTDRDIVVRAIAQNLDPDTTSVGAILSTETKPRHDGADDITSGICTLIEETPIDDAIRFMDERGIRRAAVHDHDFRLVGVLSRSDLPSTCEV